MIGNDVVDLEDPETRPETFRPRFDARVFDPAERRAIERDPHPHARRWVHWAAKEAAYKLARQVDPGFVFSPGRLVARFAPLKKQASGPIERLGRLELPTPIAPGLRVLELRSLEGPDHVHVMAIPAGADWQAVVAAALPIVDVADSPEALLVAGREGSLASTGSLEASRASRALAIQHVARDLGIEADRISIGRRGRIPTVEIDRARSNMSISLSHHGRWVACAMTHRCEEVTAQGLDFGRVRRVASGSGEASR